MCFMQGSDGKRERTQPMLPKNLLSTGFARVTNEIWWRHVDFIKTSVSDPGKADYKKWTDVKHTIKLSAWAGWEHM